MALACPTCEEAAAEYVGMADDGRNEMRCTACGHHWLLGARPVSPRAVPARPAPRAAGTARPAAAGRAAPAGRDRSGPGRDRRGAAGPAGPAGPGTVRPGPTRMPTVDDVPTSARERLRGMEAAFRRQDPGPDPFLAEFRSLYALVFSGQGLPHAEPHLLKEFATGSTLARPGTTSPFTREWNRLGDRDAADRVRGAVEHLLRGDAPTLEERLAQLLDPGFPQGMTGFRESLLTKVLCVTEPERFVPVLVYGERNELGKRELATELLELELPPAGRSPSEVARLAVRSNDLLVDVLGNRFGDLDQLGRFLWWAGTDTGDPG